MEKDFFEVPVINKMPGFKVKNEDGVITGKYICAIIKQNSQLAILIALMILSFAIQVLLEFEHLSQYAATEITGNVIEANISNR